MLKKHWSATKQEQQKTECPLTVLGSYKKPEDDPGGLLCVVDDLGCTQKIIPLSLAAGIAPSTQGLLITTFDSIHEFDPEREELQRAVITSPLFNALHSLSRTRSGHIVASTGLDLLLEFDSSGAILWEWWAIDHGFTTTPAGERRTIDKTADHRTVKYGTLQQTTHVNSVAELPDGRFLATLFHQGTVIAIDRETGHWQTVLEGLDHPHSVRILDEQHFTVADTVHGKALLARFAAQDRRAHVEFAIDAGTDWLQDCSFNVEHDTWILVDGKQSRIILRRGRTGEQPIAQFEFDAEWRLYEAYAL